MFSAGQQVPNQYGNSYGSQQGSLYGSSPYGSFGGGSTYPVNGMVVPMNTNPYSVNLTGTISDAGQLGEVLKDQTKLQGGAMGANALGALCNTATAIVSTCMQGSAMNKYYNYMNNVNDNAQEVAVAQINLEDRKLSAAQSMQAEQVDFQEKLARLQSQTQVRLLKIEEQYKTKRAEIYAATESFARRTYSSGSPFSIN